jgi:hypothetical protein
LSPNLRATLVAGIIVAIVGSIFSGPYIVPFVTSLIFPNSSPNFKSLSSDLESPQPAGSTIVWTAKALDSQKDIMIYNFILKNANTGSILQKRGWNSNNEWTWITTESDSGDYIVEAWVKDGHHATKVDESDDQISVNYKIAPNSPPYFKSLSSNFKSPQPAGSTIVWTTEATDDENDVLSYRFLLKNANTGSTLITRPWNSNNEWRLDTTDLDSGDYVVEAWVRDGHHAIKGDDSDDQFSNTYKLIDGRRIKIYNFCTSEITLILRYMSPLAGWTIDGPWIIKSNESTYLSGGKDSNYDVVRSTSNILYYNAYYSVGNNTYTWVGNYTWDYNNKPITMAYWSPYVDYENDYVLSLSCP